MLYNVFNFFLFYLYIQLGPSTSSIDLADPRSDQITYAPYANSEKCQLYLKFETPIENVLRVLIIYNQKRALNFDSSKRSFLNYDIDQ
jgi:hypothetical protein